MLLSMVQEGEFMKAIERFLKYVSFDTQSDEESLTSPSTEKQKKLGAYLLQELKDMGVDDAHMDEYGYVYGFIPSNCDSKNTIGLISHMDTSPDASGKDIHPHFVTFHGEDIEIGNGKKLTKEELKGKEGHELIVTDGTTLLGADDKAGIAIIMEMVYQRMDSKKDYPNFIICFTPDEEVGRGTEHFNYDWYKERAKNAITYTMDGGRIEEINYETFNAASAKITIHGKSIHPGSAKDKMINSQIVAMELFRLLPENERPEHTENYEGFYHLTNMKGDVETTQLSFIIRDHSREKFEMRKEKMKEVVATINEKYHDQLVELVLKDSYYNMREIIEKHFDMIDLVRECMLENGIVAQEIPVRGGTDGATLSFHEIPCPNLGTGGENFHGPLEYLDVTDFYRMIKVLETLFAKKI